MSSRNRPYSSIRIACLALVLMVSPVLAGGTHVITGDTDATNHQASPGGALPSGNPISAHTLTTDVNLASNAPTGTELVICPHHWAFQPGLAGFNAFAEAYLSLLRPLPCNSPYLVFDYNCDRYVGLADFQYEVAAYIEGRGQSGDCQ